MTESKEKTPKRNPPASEKSNGQDSSLTDESTVSVVKVLNISSNSINEGRNIIEPGEKGKVSLAFYSIHYKSLEKLE